MIHFKEKDSPKCGKGFILKHNLDNHYYKTHVSKTSKKNKTLVKVRGRPKKKKPSSEEPSGGLTSETKAQTKTSEESKTLVKGRGRPREEKSSLKEPGGLTSEKKGKKEKDKTAKKRRRIKIKTIFNNTTQLSESEQVTLNDVKLQEKGSKRKLTEYVVQPEIGTKKKTQLELLSEQVKSNDAKLRLLNEVCDQVWLLCFEAIAIFFYVKTTTFLSIINSKLSQF